MFDLNILLDYWNGAVERCGIILSNDRVIEFPNTHADPSKGFSFSRDKFTEYPNVVATWHTHPDGDPNLSVPDYKVFLTQPDLFHYIVGRDTIWGYYVRNNKVYLYEDDSI